MKFIIIFITSINLFCIGGDAKYCEQSKKEAKIRCQATSLMLTSKEEISESDMYLIFGACAKVECK